ncbi:MAG: phage holin family protein [Flavobacteriaceae bacterium]|nr:phage holin family protein [Flavobacteriaceae bacterium]
MVDLLKKYFEKRFELIKLDLITVFANMASGLVSTLLLLVLGLFILCMFSFSFAFWAGEALGSEALGFAIVGGFYTLLFAVYLFFSKDKLELKIKDQIVKSALSDKENAGNLNQSEIDNG